MTQRAVPSRAVVFGRTERYRPTEPHWYLSLIGVEALHRKKGCGAADVLFVDIGAHVIKVPEPRTYALLPRIVLSHWRLNSGRSLHQRLMVLREGMPG
jgi:hypothetical protein